jgi:hypothetical protein
VLAEPLPHAPCRGETGQLMSTSVMLAQDIDWRHTLARSARPVLSETDTRARFCGAPSPELDACAELLIRSALLHPCGTQGHPLIQICTKEFVLHLPCCNYKGHLLAVKPRAVK